MTSQAIRSSNAILHTCVVHFGLLLRHLLQALIYDTLEGGSDTYVPNQSTTNMLSITTVSLGPRFCPVLRTFSSR